MLEGNEYGCVGIGIGRGIDNTNKLKVLGFDEAMALPDKREWQVLVDHEHERTLKNGVWEVVDRNNILDCANIIDNTWAMEEKENGDYRA